MISKEKQFIFIHNFKTGGTSIEKKLGHFNKLEKDVQDHRTIKEIELLADRAYHFKNSLHVLKKGRIDRCAFHLKKTLSPELTKQEFNTFYKFTFVRNSWARMYSWYANVMKDPMMRNLYKIESQDYNFEQFLLEKINHRIFSQLYFITDSKGNIPMDFIGRFENLQQDFNVVCQALSIDDTTLPKLLVRNYGHYKENYTPKTKDLIYKLYKKEIDFFGFEYGE